MSTVATSTACITLVIFVPLASSNGPATRRNCLTLFRRIAAAERHPVTRAALLVHPPLAQFRFGGIDESAVALGVDERVHGVLRSGARGEFSVPPPPSC